MVLITAVTAVPAEGVAEQAEPDPPEAAQLDGPVPLAVPDAEPGELIVTSRADSGGYHLQVADAADGWAWRPLATILPEGAEGEPWTGYHCLTGDGRFVVAVVAPRAMSNDPAGRDRGGLVYRVELPHGEVTPIAANAATKYYNPGCGTGARAAVISHEGVDQQATTVRLYDVAQASVIDEWSLDGQVTSAVPLAGEAAAVAAARDHAVVRLDAGGEQPIVEPGGLPFQLRANAVGGADFLVTDRQSDDVAIWSTGRASGTGASAEQVGSGTLGETKLFAGRERTTVVDAGELADDSGLRPAASGEGEPIAASTAGAVVAVDVARSPEQVAASRDGATPGSHGDGHADAVDVLDLSRRELRRTSDGADMQVPEPEVTAPGGTTPLPTGLAVAGPSSRSDTATGDVGVLSHTTRTCAVPRNDPTRQAHQPSSAQVNWAIQQATRNNLRGAVLTRPALYNMWWLPAYEPSVEFPRRRLHGAPADSVPVPPSVAQAVFAQESNWKQATWRALPNVGGNPLIGDYYGSGGTLDTIDYAESDCGYGISQVTTPMSVSSDDYSELQKAIAGVDYAANVAAGLDFLVRHWNETFDAGIIANNGDPSRLENWYFAVWAYNTGVYGQGGDHLGTPHGAWGLGWHNNPIQADYPPDRSPFLRESYADAERPNDWPYQERIFGWMETPQLNYRGEQQYAEPVTTSPFAHLTIPSRTAFCNATNSCDPAFIDGSTSYCRLRVPEPICMWNRPATWASPASMATSQFTVGATATEPRIAAGSPDDNYPPNCTRLPPRSQDGRPHVIVDNAHPNLNINGCSPVGWTTGGTFTVQHGTNAHGAPLGEIDWHQLGTGFSGHTWFTKNRAPADTAHRNTGTWAPANVNGRYNIKAHIPPSGASTPSARYAVHNGTGGVANITVDQHLHENRWVSLGDFDLGPGAKVVLTNVTAEVSGGTTNVAFDAMAFTPVPTSGRIVEVTFDAAAVFDHEQPTTIAGSSQGLVSNPQEVDEEQEEWMLDHITDVLDHPTCVGTTRTATCIPPTTVWILSAFRNEINAHRPGRWNASSVDDPPDGPLPVGWLDDADRHKQYSQTTVRYRLAPDGTIDPATVGTGFRSQTGVSHMPPFMTGLFQAMQQDYGVAPPRLRYTAQNLGTYSHSSSAVDVLQEGGAMPGRGFRSAIQEPQVDGSCVTVRTIGGGVHGAKVALNEGGIAGPIAQWKEAVGGIADDLRAPQDLYEMLDGIWKHWWSNQYATPPLEYEGSPLRQAPPIWIQQDFQVCGTGEVSPAAGNPRIATVSQMPDLYTWVNRVPVDDQGDPGPSEPIVRGDFERFSRGLFTDDQSPWGTCDDAQDDDLAVARARNPWNVLPLVDGKDLGEWLRFCNHDGPVVGEHGSGG